MKVPDKDVSIALDLFEQCHLPHRSELASSIALQLEKLPFKELVVQTWEANYLNFSSFEMSLS